MLNQFGKFQGIFLTAITKIIRDKIKVTKLNARISNTFGLLTDALIINKWQFSIKEGKKMAEEKSVKKALVTNIGSLVEYQDSSIVSRTIIDKKAGTITVFAFDEGQGLSEHIAPYDAWIEVLDGEAEVVISGKSYQVGMGQMIILPAKKPHALRAKKKFKMVLTMIRA